MESPFFRNYFDSSRDRHNPSPRVIPVHDRKKFSSPKVVSIPVHFVGSEKTRSAAALKIQKIFRGYLVRKSVKKILAIRIEVDEIEQRISKRETIDLIRRETKERLKMNEMLMSLLFRLDSVRGIYSGIRDCRKAVIKKAIMLQEKIDGIVAKDQTLDFVEGEDVKDEILGIADGGAAKDGTSDVDVHSNATYKSETMAGDVHHTPEIKNPVDFAHIQENRSDHTLNVQASVDSSDNCKMICTDDDQSLAEQDPIDTEDSGDNNPKCNGDDPIVARVDHTPEIKSPIDFAHIQENKSDHTLNIQASVDSSDNCKMICTDDDQSLAEQDPVDTVTSCDIGDAIGAVQPDPNVANIEAYSSEESVETVEEEEGYIERGVSTNPSQKPSENYENLGEEVETVEKEDGMEIQELDRNQRITENNMATEGRENCDRNLMKKMIEDNEKLMGLMAELFERNELQTELLSSLSQRVELLERAFRCERLRRKKKRQAVATVEKPETTPGSKKCGRKS